MFVIIGRDSIVVLGICHVHGQLKLRGSIGGWRCDTVNQQFVSLSHEIHHGKDARLRHQAVAHSDQYEVLSSNASKDDP